MLYLPIFYKITVFSLTLRANTYIYHDTLIVLWITTYVLEVVGAKFEFM